MVNWFKRNQSTISPSVEGASAPRGLLSRLKQGLSKTRQQLGDGLGRLLLGKKDIDAALLDELEILLLRADLGMATTKIILEQVVSGLGRKQLADGDAVFSAYRVIYRLFCLPMQRL